MMQPMLHLTELLPAPLGWIDIPAGVVRLTATGGYLMKAAVQQIPAFCVARYPVTNAQYQVFVDAADGYGNPTWWTFSDDALLWWAGHPRAKPIQYGGADDPRTHVTWFEAVAYTRWLSAHTGLSLRLPTEAEWQRAAQGDDERVYPWGNEWDEMRCANSTGAKRIGTTSVHEHEGRGDSPFGVVDMVGNVWEWCLTGWQSGSNETSGGEVRVLRGGSWFDDVRSFFTVTARTSWNPEIESDLRGFRLVYSMQEG